MRSIGLKLFLGFIAMAALTVGILWFVQAGVMRDSYLKERLQSVSDAIGQAALDGKVDYDTLGEQLNANLVVISKTGDILYRSQGLPMMGMMIRSIQSMVPENANGQAQFVQGQGGSGRYAVLGSAMPGDRYLFAVFSLSDVDEAARILRHQLWIVTILLLFLAVILAVYLSRRLSRPIRAVTAAAHELAKGNLAVSLPVTSRDEIGRLTIALNDLSVELQKTDQLRKELIANVSHELRAPLAVIRGYAETVRDVTWPNDTKRQEQLTLISEEATRLTGVVRDILDYSRLQAGVEKIRQTSFQLRPLLEQVMGRYEQVAQAAGLRLLLQSPEVTIIFDEARLIQVLHNLINNAIDHATPGSAVALVVQEQNGHCRIVVRNEGETIAPEELGRIWERYHRADRAGSRPLGSGLGLAIVRSIFEQHRVSFGVSSDQGTTAFWFDAVCDNAAAAVNQPESDA
ncbi:MAG: HAMP domain-containing sensor histidine kinase [Bacillota bacterium]|nr:HAMP domain-containing sensor histidine kinase [Bacillota bacterium]